MSTKKTIYYNYPIFSDAYLTHRYHHSSPIMRLLPFLSLLLLGGGQFLTAQDFPLSDPALIALYPQQNATRSTLSLSGVWRWRKDSLGVGEAENWQSGLTD